MNVCVSVTQILFTHPLKYYKYIYFCETSVLGCDLDGSGFLDIKLVGINLVIG